MSEVESMPRRVLERWYVRWHVPFRSFAFGLVLVFAVATQLWKSILTPWVVFADVSDHGWPRTAELHRVADTASAALLTMLTAGILLSIIRPRATTAVGAWVAAMLTMITVGQIWSSLVQGHAGIVGALSESGVLLVLTAVPFVLLHPRRRDVLRGGASDPEHGPRGLTRALLWGLSAAGVLVAAAAIGWRITGGIFEDRREDDVVGIVMLGLSFALGCSLCLTRRQGWATVAAILVLAAGYCAVAGLFLAL